MSANPIIAVDLGGTNLRVALCEPSGRIIRKSVSGTGGYSSKETLIRGIVSATREVLGPPGSRLRAAAVGVGVPGPVDYRRGVVYFLPNIPGWKNVALRGILSRRLRLPVYLDNDAKLMALAEYTRGAARGARFAVCLTLGTGVGGALILNGEILRGISNSAGELGHIPLSHSREACNCGGRGCLERLIGNRSISARARAVFKRPISLEELSSRARSGDRRAAAVWQETAQHLGIVLTGIVNLLNPDRIVIGGGISNARELLFRQLRAMIKERAMPVQARDVTIVKARFSNDAGIIGAAVLAGRGVRGL